MKTAELGFLTPEQLLELLDSLSFTELYKTTEALKALHKGAKSLPAYVETVCTYMSKQFDIMEDKIVQFSAVNGYVVGKTISVHELFGNATLTLYPVEGKNPVKGKAAHLPHRPILDIEFVGRDPYARCYLGLYAEAPSSEFKDVTADESGKIKFSNIGLMNLGNPMKALLWCEDYLSSEEHYSHSDEKPAPKPVVRSFLVPLSDASGLLQGTGEFSRTRPLDQDRGSGQFGNLLTAKTNVYGEVLHPLIGSLVSFFLDAEDYAKASEKGQRKLGLVNLQEYLTGQREDPRAIVETGIAAQHERLGHKATFKPGYTDVMTAYYESVKSSETGFVGATKGAPPEKRKSKIPTVFDAFPAVKREIALLSSDDLSMLRATSTPTADSEKVAPTPEFKRLRDFVAAYQGVPVVGGGGVAPGEGGLSSGMKAPAKTSAESASPSVEVPSKPTAESSEGSVSASKAEVENPRNQYAAVEGLERFPGSWFRLIANPGGGDCLFHALEGRTLNRIEMLAIRGKIATVRRRTSDTATGPAYNANVVAATITQTPGLSAYASLVTGRQAVPNRVLALLQAIPGVYAGIEELIQWCQYRRQTVHVVDQDGTVMRYTQTGGTPVVLGPPGIDGRNTRMGALRRLLNAGHLVVYKSPAHWEKIQGPSSSFGKLPREPKNVSEEL